jgi:hypothetical protein
MFWFQTKSPNLGKILEGLALEEVSIPNLWSLGPFNGSFVILYGHLVKFAVIWYM